MAAGQTLLEDSYCISHDGGSHLHIFIHEALPLPFGSGKVAVDTCNADSIEGVDMQAACQAALCCAAGVLVEGGGVGAASVGRLQWTREVE